MKKIALAVHEKSTLARDNLLFLDNIKGRKCHTVSLNEYRCIQE